MNDVNGAEGALSAMFAAFERGDADDARASFATDAQIWHNFDCIVRNLEESVEQWKQFIAGFSERTVADVRFQPTPEGGVQQHLMVLRTADGKRTMRPVCIVVRARGGVLTRLDEYVDLSGAGWPVEVDAPTTPGM